MKQRESRQEFKSVGWQTVFEDRLAVWTHLPSVSDRLSQLGFMQSLHSTIKCIRSEEEDFARRELCKVLSTKPEVEEQVQMNSSVLRRCLNAIIETLIDTVWNEDISETSTNLNKVRKSEIQISSEHYQFRDSSESVQARDIEKTGKTEPNRHEFDIRSNKTTLPSTIMHQKSSIRSSVAISHQIIPASTQNDEYSERKYELNGKTDIAENVQKKVHRSARNQFKSPHACNKVLQHEDSSSVFASPRIDLVKEKNAKANPKVAQNKPKTPNFTDKHNQQSISQVKKSSKKSQPLLKLEENSSKPDPKKSSKSKPSNQKSSKSSKKQSKHHITNESESPSSIKNHDEYDLQHQNNDDIYHDCSDLQNDEAFNKKMAMSVKRKLLGNTAPLDVDIY